MENQNKPRLSQVAKKNTTDRASKLAGSFLPAPPTPTPLPTAVETPPNVVEEPVMEEKTVEPVAVGQVAPVGKVTPILRTAVEKPKERTRRTGVSMDLSETINQPVPDGLRCTRMIMLCDEHHDLLRELSFRFKKPMTAILYNLIETANQANDRDKQKGALNHV